MSGMSPVLEVSGLTVAYGLGDDAVYAVRDVDLTLHRGEVLGLAGESGSGKSTLAYAVTRLLRAPGVITAGHAHFHRRPYGLEAGVEADEVVDLMAVDAHRMRTLRWAEIAVVFQSALHALNPVMTIHAQLDDVLRTHRPNMNGSDRKARAAELLRLVGISADRLGSYPHELSGGMRQRVMIAMALALEPGVVIMDEPTTALDVVTQREILDELIGLRDRLGFAVIFITHDLSLLIELADSIAVMYGGRLVEHAPANTLFRAPRHPYTYGLLNSFPSLHGNRQRMTGITGSPPDLRHLPAGCSFNPRCAHVQDVCRTGLPPLADLTPERRVACWLHDPSARTKPAPVELALPDVAPRAVRAVVERSEASIEMSES